MTATLDDLQRRLDARARTTTPEILAARARLEGRLVRAARPPRHGRRVLAVAVAAVVIGVLAAAVVAVVHPSPTTTPAAAGPTLPVTDYLFDLDDAPLAAAGLTASFGGADASNQRALVVPVGAPANTAYTAVVLVAYDPAALDVAVRPTDATDVTVAGNPGWTAPHLVAGDDTAYGIDGVVTTWTDRTGLTAKVVAGDGASLAAVTSAVRLGRNHPVLFPARFAPGAFPAGARLVSVETDFEQGARIEIARPGLPLLAVAVNRPRINVTPGAATEPLTGNFRLCVPRLRDVDLLTDGRRDLEIDIGRPEADLGEPVLPLADLTSLVAAMTFADVTSGGTWYPVSSAVPLS